MFEHAHANGCDFMLRGIFWCAKDTRFSSLFLINYYKRIKIMRKLLKRLDVWSITQIMMYNSYIKNYLYTEDEEVDLDHEVM